MDILKSLLIYLFILGLFLQSIPAIAGTPASSNDCNDSLVPYSQEDIDVAIVFAYEKGVREVVGSLEIPYPQILRWIYQREKVLAEKNGGKVKGSSSIAFLSGTYKIGVINFAVQVGISEAAKQIDINRRALTRLVDKMVRPVIRELHRKGKTPEDMAGFEALLASIDA